MDLFWAYVLAITLLTITPGVDTLLVMRNAGRGGLGDGCLTSLGICSGLFIHASLSALGISVLLVQTAWAFTTLKWLGALYLIWLGIGSLRQALKPSSTPAPDAQVFSQSPPQAQTQAVASRPVPWHQAFREGLFSNVFNPKTALFYMALLPQFIDPASSALAQSMFLASVHFGLAMLWQCGLAWVVVRFRGLGASARLKRALNLLTGGFFVAIGARLASS